MMKIKDLLDCSSIGVNTISIDPNGLIKLSEDQGRELIHQFFAWQFHCQALAFNQQRLNKIDIAFNSYDFYRESFKDSEQSKKRYFDNRSESQKRMKGLIWGISNSSFLKLYADTNFLNPEGHKVIEELGVTCLDYTQSLIENYEKIANQNFIKLEVLNSEMDWLADDPYSLPLFTISRLNRSIELSQFNNQKNPNLDPCSLSYIADLRMLLQHSLNSINNYNSVQIQFSNFINNQRLNNNVAYLAVPNNNFILTDSYNYQYNFNLVDYTDLLSLQLMLTLSPAQLEDLQDAKTNDDLNHHYCITVNNNDNNFAKVLYNWKTQSFYPI